MQTSVFRDNFKLVKEKIPTIQAVKIYGLNLKQQSGRWWANCPFHQDKHPSFVIFPDGGWRCFGCGISGGDSIDFVSKLFNISQGEALKKLARDFRITLQRGNSRPRHKAVEKTQENETKYQKYITLRNDVIEYLYRLFRLYSKIKLDIENQEDINSPEFVEACHKQDIVEYFIDILNGEDIEAQLKVISEVKSWAENRM
jgi:hypothetical protein